MDKSKSDSIVDLFEDRKILALKNFDKWNEITGYIPKGCTYEWEIKSLIEDAVEIGLLGNTVEGLMKKSVRNE